MAITTKAVMADAKEAKPVVFVDADNTLWDTDAIFAEAQLQLLANVEAAMSRVAPKERLAFVRTIDQILAEQHHEGMRYPPRLLAVAASRALQGHPLENSLIAVWKQPRGNSDLSLDQAEAIERIFTENVRHAPELLPGVASGLKRLRDAGIRIFVISEGDRGKVIRLLETFALRGYVDKVVEAAKHERLYRRILKLAGSPTHAWMVGDQLARDIAPASAAGVSTIYIPSRFRPRWEPSQSVVVPSFKVERFDQAVDFILASC